MIQVFGAKADRDEIEAISPTILAGWMGMGPRVAEFERRLATRLGSGFLMVDSGSSALHLAVKALDLPAGSDVLVPSFTWVGCAHAVLMAGHRPVFTDVELGTANVDGAAIERALTPRTAAIMVVHYGGKPVRMEAILAFGLAIIEDAAHAIDSQLDGHWCGTLGTVGAYSFGSIKNLATPGAGGLTASSRSVLDRARSLRYCGIGEAGFDRRETARRWWEYDVVDPFPRTTPNDVSAGIGLVQLDKIEDHQRRRRQVWEHYQRALADVGWIARPPEPEPDERHSYFTYLIRVVNGRRDAVARALLERGVYTTLRYHPLHLSPMYRSTATLPNSELLSEQGLNLPLHPALSDEDVERVVDAICSL